MLEVLTKITNGNGTLEDLDTLKNLSSSIKTGSLCGLGQTAANPVLSTINKFYPVYLEHVTEKKCPNGVCKKLISFHIDPNKCKKCSMCARNCPTGCISGVVGKEVFKIDTTKCVKCGTCIAVCKFGAVYKK